MNDSVPGTTRIICDPPDTLVILGTCGGAREASQIVREFGARTRIVFVNDVDQIDKVVIGTELFPVVSDWNFERFRQTPGDFRHFIVGMGDPYAKQIVARKARAAGLKPAPALISRDAVVRPGVRIGQGSAVHPQSYIGDHAVIGECAVVHMATVAHDVRIGAYTTCSPHSVTGARAWLEEGVHIAGRAVVAPGVHIAAHVYTGLNAAIKNDIEESGAVYAGIPARLLRMRNGL